MTVHSKEEKTKGFSLPETLVIIALIATSGLALQNALTSFYRQNTYVLESTTQAENARRGLTVSLKGLREATYGEDGSFPLSNVSTSSIIFYGDVDSDNSVERVRFYTIGTTLYRTVTNAGGNPPSYTGQTPATSTIATYVKNATSTPIFRYYDVNGAELTGTVDVTDVSSIGIRLDIDLNPNRAPELFTITGSATIRNLRNE